MAYRVRFDSSETYQAASHALAEDMNAMGMQNTSRIYFDASLQEIRFDMNAIELGVLFGETKRSQTAQFIPFNLSYPPLTEGFDATARQRGIEGVSITRSDGDFIEGYRQARSDSQEELSRSTATPPMTGSSHLHDALADSIKQGALVIGEAHGNRAHLQFLFGALPEIAQQKKPVILLEHFFQDQQPLLDDYMASPKGSALPAELAAYVDHFIDPKINGAKPGSPHSTRHLLELCKESGTRPIGIETEYSFASDSLHAAAIADNPDLKNNLPGVDERVSSNPQTTRKSMEDRLLLMNAAAASTWHRIEEPGLFPVVLAGANHNVDYISGYKGKDGRIPGLGSIFHAAPIFVMDEGTPAALREQIISTVQSTGNPPAWLARLEETIKDAKTFVLTEDGNDHPVSPPLIPQRHQRDSVKSRMPDGR